MARLAVLHKQLRKFHFVAPILDALGLQFLLEESSLIQVVPLILRIVSAVVYLIQAIFGFLFIVLYMNFNGAKEVILEEYLLPILAPTIGIIAAIVNNNVILTISCVLLVYNIVWFANSLFMPLLYMLGITGTPYQAEGYAFLSFSYGLLTLLFPLIGAILSVVLLLVKDIFDRLNAAGIRVELIDGPLDVELVDGRLDIDVVHQPLATNPDYEHPEGINQYSEGIYHKSFE